MSTTPELAARLKLLLEINLVRANDANVPGDKNTGIHSTMMGGKAILVTCHDTQNEQPGADARFHRRFVADGGGVSGVSFSYAVDSFRAVQILPENAVNIAQGTAIGNRTSISVEMCVNRDGDVAVMLENAAKLFASILAANDLPISALVQHNFWQSAKYPNGKNCPRSLREVPGAWERLRERVRLHMDALASVAVMNGIEVGEPFLTFWRANGGLPIFGYPVRPREQEIIGGQSFTVQWFERGRFEIQPDGRVTLGRIGSELLKCRAA